MKIEIWSDFVCPFCYIGKRHLEQALAQVPFGSEVSFEFKSFELDPRASRDSAVPVVDMLAKKYGVTREQAWQMNANVAAQAARVGLEYNFEKWVSANTFDAHRLAQFAAERGKGTEMTERLFYAHFTEAKNLGDRETLLALAEEVGFDRAEAAAALERDDLAERVRSDEREAAELGVRGVPFFVIDRKYAVSGAQPVAVFVGALNKAWDERKASLTVVGGGDAAVCEDGSCAVPEGAAKRAD